VIFRLILLFFVSISFLQAKSSKVTGYYANNKEVIRFINFMIRKHNFKRSYLIDIFSKAGKPKRFRVKRKKKIVPGIARGRRGYLAKSGYTKFEKAYLTEDRVRDGVKFIRRYNKKLSHIEKKYRVDKEILVAIVGVETYYGYIKGEYEAFNVLSYYSFKNKRKILF